MGWCQWATANYRVGKNLKFDGLGFKGTGWLGLSARAPSRPGLLRGLTTR